MPKLKKLRDYPIPYIRKCLVNYGLLEDRKWFENEGGEQRKSKPSASPHEPAIIAKADIDRAIDALGTREKALIEAMYIVGHPRHELEILFPDRSIVLLEQRAVRNMGKFLNGECVLQRWCRENGLCDHEHKGSPRIPEDLPTNIAQYVKDICIRYCVLEECPE